MKLQVGQIWKLKKPIKSSDTFKIRDFYTCKEIRESYTEYKILDILSSKTSESIKNYNQDDIVKYEVLIPLLYCDIRHMDDDGNMKFFGLWYIDEFMKKTELKNPSIYI